MGVLNFAFILLGFGAISVLAQYDLYQARPIRNCQEARLCCQGVNNTCYVPNAQKLDGSYGRCYCDGKCLQSGDCCSDFQEYCEGEKFYLRKKFNSLHAGCFFFMIFCCLLIFKKQTKRTNLFLKTPLRIPTVSNYKQFRSRSDPINVLSGLIWINWLSADKTSRIRVKNIFF